VSRSQRLLWAKVVAEAAVRVVVEREAQAAEAALEPAAAAAGVRRTGTLPWG